VNLLSVPSSLGVTLPCKVPPETMKSVFIFNFLPIQPQFRWTEAFLNTASLIFPSIVPSALMVRTTS
jgi:hypothetical protein